MCTTKGNRRGGHKMKLTSPTLIILALLTGLSHSAMADGKIQGTWKLEKQECSSGAPYGSGPYVKVKIDFTSTITDTEIQLKIDSSIKYEKSYADDVSKR